MASEASQLKSGTYKIDHGLPLYVKWKNNGSDHLVVTFSAAITSNVEKLPVFSGASLVDALPCNFLMIADPSLVLDRETTVAWYAGNRYQPSLQSDLASVIGFFSAGSEIILLGGSGGGYSALLQHTKIENATTLVINPSTRISGRPVFKSYLRKIWGVEQAEDLPSDVTLDVSHSFASPVGGEVYYVQNSFDQNFVKNYFWPFAESLHEQNLVYFMTPFYAKGHVPLGKESIKSMLEILLRERDWGERRRSLASLNLAGRKNISHQILPL